MSDLPNDNRETVSMGEAAGQMADTGKGKGNQGSNGGERTHSPVFENWLMQYRNRLAKARQARNSTSGGLNKHESA